MIQHFSPGIDKVVVFILDSLLYALPLGNVIRVALWIDEVTGVKEVVPGKYSETKEALSYAEFNKGVAGIEENIILIYDLEQCLYLKEEMELDKALSSNNI